MKMKLICIGKVLRLALSMHVLCAAPLMSLISRMVFVFNFEQLLFNLMIIIMMVMMIMINYLNFSLFMHCLSFRELLLQTEKLGIWNLLIIGSVKGKRI